MTSFHPFLFKHQLPLVNAIVVDKHILPKVQKNPTWFGKTNFVYVFLMKISRDTMESCVQLINGSACGTLRMLLPQ